MLEVDPRRNDPIQFVLNVFKAIGVPKGSDGQCGRSMGNEHHAQAALDAAVGYGSFHLIGNPVGAVLLGPEGEFAQHVN